MTVLLNQRQRITECNACAFGRQDFPDRARTRVTGAIEQQRMRGEPAREIQVVTREDNASARFFEPLRQCFQAIDLMMQVEVGQRFIE